MGGPPPTSNRPFGGPPSGLNGGNFERKSNWSGPVNGGGGSGGNMMNRGPSRNQGGMNDDSSGEISTQVTIPKDVSVFNKHTFNLLEHFAYWFMIITSYLKQINFCSFRWLVLLLEKVVVASDKYVLIRVLE